MHANKVNGVSRTYGSNYFCEKHVPAIFLCVFEYKHFVLIDNFKHVFWELHQLF